MLKNYIRIAWRKIIRNPFHSSLNIVGLSTGIAFSLLIGAFVWQELQVNKELKNADRQYIIQSKWKDPNMGIELTTLGPLARRLKEEYPNQVANYYRWYSITTNVSKDERHFREGLQIGDSTMLSMYGFSLTDGDARTALRDPYSVVINSDKALKYFGRTNVVGQTLSIENTVGAKHDFKITGVIKRLPQNSITQLDANNDNGFYFPLCDSAYFGRNIEQWNDIYIVNYIELQKGASPEALEKVMAQLIQRNAPARINDNIHPYLASLQNYYLDANGATVRKMLYTLSFIVLFILAMAIINFVNISIGKSASRMTETGIRKVLGGLRTQLIGQFLTESIIVVFLATGMALVMYRLAQNYFGKVLGKEIMSLGEFPAYFILIPIVLALVIGILAGLYPAFVLTSLKPTDSLKKRFRSVKSSILLRKSLIAFQFITASMAFIAAIIISQQVAYFFGKDLGYDKDYVISAQVPRDWTPDGAKRMENIRHEFTSLPQVKEVSLSFEIPNGNNGDNSPAWKSGQDSAQAIGTMVLTADKDYARTYGIPMAAGNFFDERNDPSKVVINEMAARAFGWRNAQDAIGRQIRVSLFSPLLTVSGVTKDFHFGSMQGKIEPLVFTNVNLAFSYRYLSFKIRPGNVSNTIAALQQKWVQAFPSTPFGYAFMDDRLKEIYRTELKLKQASYLATALSLIIILLGIIGLISLSIQNRTKEIGIRKVVGAPVLSIILLFLKEFLMVIGVAGILACPFAYILMEGWLSDYAYRIPITPMPFLVSLFALGSLTALLIVFQTIKAAMTNPVTSLRSE